MKTIRFCFIPAFALLSIRLALAAAPAAWNPPAIDPVKWQTGEISAVACDPAARKVYVGVCYQAKRMNLLVFDAGKDGAITTAPRRLADHPEPMPVGHWSKVDCLLLDTKHHKLFLGLSTSIPAKTPRLLVMYSLDAQGEPIGPPEAFATGNPQQVCDALTLHPTLHRLYATGWGYAGVSVLDLDDTGRPAGQSTVFPVGGYGKFSVAIRADGTRAYLGTYPDSLEICQLDSAGNVTNTVRNLTVPGGAKWYLSGAATEHALYFVLATNQLHYVALDAAGDPAGAPVKLESFPAQGVVATGPDRVVLAQAHTFTDAINGKICTDGVQLREFAVKPDGAPGELLRESKPFGRQSLAALTGSPGIAVAGKHLGWEFLGNRFAGLMLRTTLVSLEGVTTLPPAKTTVSFGKPDTYLAFVYSPTRGTTYSVLGESVLACQIGKDAAGQPVAVACPGAAGPLAIDDAAGKLYVAKKDGGIAVFALPADGLPADAGTTLATGLSPITLLRVNPKTHQLYVFSQQPGKTQELAGVSVVPVPGAMYQMDAVIDTERGRLYGTSNYNGNENLWVWKLAADGTVLPDKPQTYPDGLNGGEKKLRSLTGSVKVDGKRRRLYTVANLEQSRGQGQLVVYALDENGDPAGSPRLYPSRNTAGTPDSLGVSNDGQWLYESGWGEGTIYAHKLDAAGDLTETVNPWPGGQYGKYSITMTPDGRRLLAGTYPSQLEIIRLHLDGRPEEAVSLAWDLDKHKADLGLLAAGESTPWLKLDDGLKDGIGIGIGHLTLGGGPVRKATLKFEVVQAQGDSPKPLATMSVNLEGNLATLFLPRYGTDEVEKLPELIQTTDLRFKQYLSYAKPWALKPAERPKQFVVANGLIPMDSSPVALEYGLEILGALGHNTAQIWTGSLPPETIRAVALRNGITRFRGATYNPPSYFAFVQNMETPEFLDKWTLDLDKSLAGQGAKPDEVALYHIADEPGWYYPAMLEELKSKPEYLAVFRDYVKAKGMTPELLGKTSWDQVLPIGQSTAQTSADRRLFYWTMRFFPDSMSQSFAAATEAFQRRYNRKIFTGTNLANWPGRYVINTPKTKYANNADTGPDAGYGGPDWFNLGRHSGVTCLWTEDWFADGESQLWSLYADLMRCAARESNLEFGGYVVGHPLGFMENGEGGKYKIMALMGHGGKGLDPYLFGPNLAFADGWSEKPFTYRALAEGIRMLGRSEPLTWPGRPRNGTVAILFPQASQVWDVTYNLPMNQQELYGLHAALIHKQYPVDFVDDTDVEEGALQKFGYATLYVTAPNLSAKAQQAILDWVKAGGTLVLFPGAGTANEYNEPLPVLVGAAGVTWENYARINMPHISEFEKLPVTGLTVTDPAVDAKADSTRFQAVPMALHGAKPLAAFTNGLPAMAQIDQGKGRIFSFGYWPGSTYWNSPDRGDHTRLPAGWSPDGREIITAPARLAGAKKYVSASVDLVEGVMLESDKGTAVTLLNWSGEPQKNLVITIAVSEEIAAAAKAGKLKVESLELGALKYKLAGGDLNVTLPLKTVDVLMISSKQKK